MGAMRGLAGLAVVTLALLVCAADTARAQQGASRWLRAESASFIVYGHGNERQMREAVQSLEDFDAALRILTNVAAPPTANKFEIFLLGSASALRVVFPGASSGVRGFYRQTPDYVAAFALYNDDVISREEILFHEYAHHFMLQYFPNAFPRWYIEGWAEFVSTAEIDDRRVIIGTPSSLRSQWIRLETMLPIDELLAPERVTRRRSNFDSLFYAQSWFAAAYISNHPESRDGLIRYVNALAEGADPIEAFEPAFGMTPDAFDAALRRFGRGRVQIIAVSVAETPATVTITRMPEWADDLLLPLACARMACAEEDRMDPFVRNLVRQGTRHLDSEEGLLALAYAARMQDDTVAARAHLEQLLARNEAHAEARYMLASILYSQVDGNAGALQTDALLQETRRHLVRGFRANPDHVPTLFLYALTHADAAAPMSNDQLEVMARAVELVPRVTEIRMRFAGELIEAEMYEAAVVALRPLMYAPHAERQSERARQMSEAARRGEQPPPWTDEEEEAEEEEEEEEEED